MPTDVITYSYDTEAAAVAGSLFRHLVQEAGTLGGLDYPRVTRRPSAPYIVSGAAVVSTASIPTALTAEQDESARHNAVQDVFALMAESVDAPQLLAYLERQALKGESWQNSMDATIALLRYAHLMIEKAEATIRTQEDRIGQLETLVTTDELTGLQNRRGFYHQFVQALDCCDRDLSTGGLLAMIDLDNFKAVNDIYGHLAGDSALRLVAQTLLADIRPMDVAARLGGDEFVLLLAHTDKKKAAGRIQALVSRLNNLSLAWAGDIIPIRASVGLRDFGKGDTPHVIFNDADMCLYADKAQRKANREAGNSISEGASPC